MRLPMELGKCCSEDKCPAHCMRFTCPNCGVIGARATVLFFYGEIDYNSDGTFHCEECGAAFGYIDWGVAERLVKIHGQYHLAPAA